MVTTTRRGTLVQPVAPGFKYRKAWLIAFFVELPLLPAVYYLLFALEKKYNIDRAFIFLVFDILWVIIACASFILAVCVFEEPVGEKKTEAGNGRGKANYLSSR